MFAFLLLLPAGAFAFKVGPCLAKKKFDQMPIPSQTPVAMVTGHEFRKIDRCVPVQISMKWLIKNNSFDHNFYAMEASEIYPGEFWYRTDREEFVIAAAGVSYSGRNKVMSLNASGESCRNSYGSTCRMWSKFDNSHVKQVRVNDSATGSFLYEYPTVITSGITSGETVDEKINIVPPHFEFRKNRDEYSRPSMVEINNLSVVDTTPFKYRDLVKAASTKKPYEKEIEWNNNENIDENPSHNEGSLSMRITFDSECPGSFEVVSPAADARYVFSEENPGVATIEAVAGNFRKISPDLVEKIKWDVAPKEGTTVSYDPPSQTGSRIKIQFTGLPKKNSDLGVTAITAKLSTGDECDEVSAAKNVKLFFPRDAKNSPDASVPNWYYYWSQTSAAKGPMKFGALEGECAAGANSNDRDGIIGYYRYIRRDRNYFICDLTRLANNFEFTAVRVKRTPEPQIEPAKVYGIDTFAVASHHENAHFTHFKDWWFGFNPNPIRPSGGHMMASYDSDEDFIPNSVEPALELNPNNKYTLKQYDPLIDVNDEEYLCWLEEAKWNIGSADGEDWAKPGKQW